MTTKYVHRATRVPALIGGVTVLCFIVLAQASDNPPTSMPSPQEEQTQLPDAGPPSETGDIHERGVIRDHRAQPGTITPPQPIPTPLHPGRPPQLMLPATPLEDAGSALGQRYVGPTDDLTKVANALSWYHKSLTTLVTVKPGLALTQPVTISIAYLSPAGPGPGSPERLTQSYVASTGNRFLRLDPEGNGHPRRIHLDINLSEPNPAGGVYSFNVPVDMDLDPLYDVTISPLVFQLIVGCATIGANQIDLNWYPPESSSSDTYRTIHFATKERERFTIREFGWARAEVSASANLRTPIVWYRETGFHTGFGPRPGVALENLVPGKTHSSSPGLVNSVGSTQDCQATMNYTMTYTLRWYADLDSPNVRDHR